MTSRMKDSALLAAGTHLVYMLVSQTHTKITYVGVTSNIRKRLNDHNSLHGGSNWTDNVKYKPWGLMGIVTGFESRRKAESFETLWQNTIKKEQDSNNYQLNANAKLHLAEKLFKEYSDVISNLRLQIMGYV